MSKQEVELADEGMSPEEARAKATEERRAAADEQRTAGEGNAIEGFAAPEGDAEAEAEAGYIPGSLFPGTGYNELNGPDEEILVETGTLPSPPVEDEGVPPGVAADIPDELK